MSRSQTWMPGLRWGQRMRDGVTVDAMAGALTDPFDGCHMGVTAENVARQFGISRADQMHWRQRATAGPRRQCGPATSPGR
jgi:acetyl-CoA C-acetyltransferase